MFTTGIVFVCFVAGCATTRNLPPTGAITVPGIYHKVRQGESIWRIAKMYNVPLEDIVNINKIPNAAQIERNQLIFIPTVKTMPVVVDKDVKTNEFDWPLKGKVVSFFGDQRGLLINHGIDIRSETDEKVSAARDGKVVFADYLNGYGYTVILDHLDDFFTIYSKNFVLLVKVNDAVTKGSPIARLAGGQDALLHFEIRKKSTATNPLYYLP